MSGGRNGHGTHHELWASSRSPPSVCVLFLPVERACSHCLHRTVQMRLQEHYRDRLMRELRTDFELQVKHRTLHHYRHPLPRRLPGYAERELAEVRDRAALLQQVPTHFVNVWREGALNTSEAVSIPLTGWSNSGGSCALLTFDAVSADLDKKPLLVSSSSGPLELASEVHLVFRAASIRVWRYGRPNAEAFACGKRSIHLFPEGSSGPQASELRDATGGEQWHAMSDDGASLLQLDVPSFGTDGLEDAWHVIKAQVSLPIHELLRNFMPTLYPRWPLATTAEPPVAVDTQVDGALDSCQLEVGLYSATGQKLASGRVPCHLASTGEAQLALRRVKAISWLATPTEPTTSLRLQKGSADEAAPKHFAPRAGILSVVLRQQRQVVAAACAHFTGALNGLSVTFSVGDAEYEDESGVAQREPMQWTLSYTKLLADVRDASSGDEEWQLHGLKLSVLVPAEDHPGVSFRPHACSAVWAKSLRVPSISLARTHARTRS